LPGIADELLGFASRLTGALAAALGFARAAAFFLAIGLGRAVEADFFAGAFFFLADACALAVRFVAVRLAGRAADRFRADLAGAARRAALRLAIATVLSEP
jgi:hypothetical protein